MKILKLDGGALLTNQFITVLLINFLDKIEIPINKTFILEWPKKERDEMECPIIITWWRGRRKTWLLTGAQEDTLNINYI